MSPAPRKKQDEEAPTAAEVEAQVSEEAAKSVPRAEDETAEEASAAEGGRGDETSEAGPTVPAKKPRTRKKADAEEAPENKPAKKEEEKAPARKRDRPRAQRQPGEARVVVRAQARYVRTSARKARLVCDHIRGKDVEQARAILSFTPRGAAKPWLKLLESAIANAEHNHELVGDELRIHSIHADEGPTLKRYRPRAMGRATRIRKRTSHLTIMLTPKE
jgi:ribosomal protein L22